MVRKRRAIAVAVVVTVAGIAACLGPTLSSVEQEQIIVSEGSTVFIMPNPVMVGAMGNATVTLSPAGGAMSSHDRVEAITENCSQFFVTASLPADVIRSCTSGSMTMPAAGPNDTACLDTFYQFTVTFAPTAAGSAQCTVTITGTDIKSGSAFLPVTVVVAGSASAPSSGVEVTPTVLNFGDVRVNSSAVLPINIRNTGTSNLSVTTPITASPMVPYNIGGVSPNPIPSNGSADVSVTCAPGSAGTFNSTIAVMTSAGTRNVMASCAGVNTNLTVDPINITARVGESVGQMVTITNAGTSPTTINGFAIVPGNVGATIPVEPNTPFTLGSGSSTSALRVEYLPTIPHAVKEVAKLRITHDMTAMREVPINATALETDVEVNPDAIDFGPVCAGTTEMQAVTVRAPKPGHVGVTGIRAPSAPFMLTSTSGFPQTAQGNGTTTLSFMATVSPPNGTAGEVTSVGGFTLDIPGTPRYDLALKAEVLPGGVGASPQSIDFGGVTKNMLSPAMPTEVRNCSDQPLTITSVAIEGVNAADFQIVLPAEAERLKTLEPQESIVYQVVMLAPVPGAKMAALVIESESGASTVNLVGTALGASESDVGDKITYYTCSNCESGGGTGLLALVIYAGLRRRRGGRKK